MTDQTITCPYCGSEWSASPDMRFCGHCGSKLGALSPEITDKERRTLTVLFADLAGFTSFSEERDPEAVEETVDALLGELGTVVERYDGYVDKYLGDAVMAVFGAPRAHEDDPFRAVRAGLEMVDTVAEYDESLSLSVGINTGEVLWSQVGGGDYTVTGDAVNVAQRLEAAADENRVLAADSTRSRTESVRYGEAQRVSIEGRAKPVEAVTVAGLVGTDVAGDAVEIPLSGRERELSQILERHESAGPTLLAVTGPAGIGDHAEIAGLST